MLHSYNNTLPDSEYLMYHKDPTTSDIYANIQIYCYNMTTDNPMDYVTLTDVIGQNTIQWSSALTESSVVTFLKVNIYMQVNNNDQML